MKDIAELTRNIEREKEKLLLEALQKKNLSHLMPDGLYVERQGMQEDFFTQDHEPIISFKQELTTEQMPNGDTRLNINLITHNPTQ